MPSAWAVSLLRCGRFGAVEFIGEARERFGQILLGPRQPVGRGVRRRDDAGLARVSEEYRKMLRKKGLITRDSRVVERKKYGQAGARRRFQFSKR